MSEKFSGEKDPAPEKPEDQKYREYQEAKAEKDRIMEEIEKVIASTPDRAKAEKIVLENWAPLIDEDRKKTDEAEKVWSDAISEASKREIGEELNEIEKNLDNDE